MQIHHTKHHQTYVDKLNAGMEKYPEYAPLSIEELVKSYPVLPIELKPLIATHGCGHFNHSLMRSFLDPDM
jgi:Fe-Mn family superoxide dismutase